MAKETPTEAISEEDTSSDGALSGEASSGSELGQQQRPEQSSELEEAWPRRASGAQRTAGGCARRTAEEARGSGELPEERSSGGAPTLCDAQKTEEACARSKRARFR